AQADEAADPGIVVDDEDDGAGRRAAGPGPREKQLEIAPPVPAVAAGGVEGGHAPVIRPLANRRLRDAQELRGLSEREPVRLRRRRTPPRVAHGRKVAKAAPT